MRLRSIDSNISPCDNFFRHACRKGNEKNIDSLFDDVVKEFFDSLNYTSQNEDVKGFQKVVETPVEEILADFQRQTLKEFQGLSENQISKYVAKIGKIFKEHSVNAEKCLNEVKGNSKMFSKCLEIIAEDISEKVKIYKWLSNDGKSAISRLNETLEDIRNHAVNLIQETPWIKNAHKLQVFEKLAKNIPFLDEFENYREISEDHLEKAATRFKNCTNSSKTIHSISNVICMFDFKLTYGFGSIIGYGNDAHNLDYKLEFGENYYFAAKTLKNDVEFMGFAGFTLGHEFGHSIIVDNRDIDDDANLMFSNVTKECIQNQFKNSCDQFKEGACYITENKFDDNGSDLIGFELTYDLFKQKQERQAASQKNVDSISPDKLFFYAYATRWCVQGTTGGSQHSPQNIRVNAVVVQVPDFAKLFGCSADSPLMQTNKKQCVVFGKDASTTK